MNNQIVALQEEINQQLDFMKQANERIDILKQRLAILQTEGFEPFHMVWVEGGNSPKVAHQTLETARAEAERLANKEQKKTFVLSAVGGYRPQEKEEVSEPEFYIWPLSNDNPQGRIQCKNLRELMAVIHTTNTPEFLVQRT